MTKGRIWVEKLFLLFFVIYNYYFLKTIFGYLKNLRIF